MAHQVALVTGGNRGIGLEICRQLKAAGLTVILSARDAAKGKAEADRLGVAFCPLDVADDKSVRAAHAWARAEQGGVDVLVNNAGILIDEGGNPLQTDFAVYRQTFEVNVYGPLRTMQAFVPDMVSRGYGRVVNVSSRAGQLSSMNTNAPAYSASKTALNALTRQVAAAAGGKVLVNTMCPGWVRTDMGGSGAPRSVEQGADTVTFLATLPDGGPSGRFWADRVEIPW
jgi:NAD(P)-dependent dehydrogenase (short-subunit alcohol dehydrogenase family)